MKSKQFIPIVLFALFGIAILFLLFGTIWGMLNIDAFYKIEKLYFISIIYCICYCIASPIGEKDIKNNGDDKNAK